MVHPFNNSGYKPPALVDPRNFVYEKAFPVVAYPPSYKTDLTALGVYNQLQVPDCVENTVTLAHRYYLSKLGTSLGLSRRFLTALTVKADGFPFSDGTSLANALKIAHSTGICESRFLVDDHTLDDATFSALSFVIQDALNNASTHKLTNYAWVTDLSEQGLKSAIYQHGIIAVGLKLDKAWWTDTAGNVTWEASKILPLRPPTDAASMSGHAVVLTGYDEKGFFLQNSFGSEWGDNGSGYFGLNYLKWIYEGVTLVDLSPSQVQALTIPTTIQNLQNVQTPQNVGIIQSLIAQLQQLFVKLWSAGSSFIR